MSSFGFRAATFRTVVVLLPLLAGCSAEQHGQDLFESHCADCHEETHPDLKKQPPHLEGLFHSKSLPSGAPATDEQVQKTILLGIGIMPAFNGRLSEKEVRDIVKYLHTLK